MNTGGFPFWEIPCVPVCDGSSKDGPGLKDATIERIFKNERIESRFIQLNRHESMLFQAYADSPSEMEDSVVNHRSPISPIVQDAIAIAKQWSGIVQDRTRSKQLFEMLFKQHHETIMVLQEEEEQLCNLMDIQAEEMLALSLDGTPQEIMSLVETHVAARQSIEHTLQTSLLELVERQRIEFHRELKRLSLDNGEQICSQKSVSQNVPEHRWRAVDISQPILRLADLASPDGGTMDQVRFDARSLGKRVVSPWSVLIPESLSLVGLSDSSKLQAAGIQSPIVGAESIIVQMGSGLKVSFKILAALTAHPVCSIYEAGKFELWYSHAQALHGSSQLCAILAPSSVSTGDVISKARRRSPELHYPISVIHSRNRTTIELCSNLLGAHAVLRSDASVLSSIEGADQLGCFTRVVIPFELFEGEPAKLMRQVKAALSDCAATRFVSGSSLSEVVFTRPAGDILEDERTKWLARMKVLMTEIFD